MNKQNVFLVTAAVALFLGTLGGGCSKQSRVNRYLDKANTYFNEGNYDAAEVEYMNVMKLSPVNATAIAQMGIMFQEQGRMSKVFPYLLKARELNPENLNVRIKLGRAFLAAGRVADAKAEANYVLDREPRHEEAPLLLVETTLRAEEAGETRRRLQSLTGGKTPAVTVAIGMLDLRENRVPPAEENFKQAQLASPKFAPAFHGLALARWAQRDLTGAEAAFSQVAKLAPRRSPLLLQPVIFYMRTNKPEAARKILAEITKTTPDFLAPWMVLADLALGEKKYADAGAAVGKVLAREPTHGEAMLFIGRLKLAEGQPAQAVIELEKMIQVYPRYALAHYQLGMAHWSAGDLTKAHTSLSVAVLLSPAIADAVIALAGVNVQKGDFRPAVIALQPIVQKKPELTRAQLLLAEAHRGLSDWTEALAVYQGMLKATPNNPQVIYLMGLVLVQQERFRDARTAFEQVLTTTTGLSPALEPLVNIDIIEKKFDEARRRVNAYILKHPQEAILQLLLAKILYAEKNLVGTEAALLKAIELDPASSTAYSILARLYLERGDSANALKRLEEVAAKNPKELVARLLMGTLYEQQKEYTKAFESYKQMLEANPKSGAALNNLAYLYSEQFNEPKKALEHAEKAKEALPHDAHVSDTLGWILYKKGEYARALPLLTESANKLPDEPVVRLHLGLTLYMMGEDAAARVALERGLRSKADLPGAEDARERLAILAIEPGSAIAESRVILEEAIARRPDPVALVRLGSIQERSGALDKATISYESALKLNPNNVPAAVKLIRAYAARKEPAKALELAKATRKLAPTDPDVARSLGQLAFESGDHPWALSLIQEAARKQSDNPELLYELGVSSYSVGQVSAAESSFKAALETKTFFPQIAETKLALELLAHSANPKDSDVAETKIEEALKADSKNLVALMAKGVSSERKKDLKHAQEVYEQILQHYPEFTLAKKRLVILYAQNPAHYEKAYSLGVKTREAFPGDPELGRVLGIVSYHQKDFSLANILLQEIVGRDSKDAEALFYLGMSRYQLKQTAQSKEALQHAVALDLPPTLAAEARKTLGELK